MTDTDEEKFRVIHSLFSPPPTHTWKGSRNERRRTKTIIDFWISQDSNPNPSKQATLHSLYLPLSQHSALNFPASAHRACSFSRPTAHVQNLDSTHLPGSNPGFKPEENGRLSAWGGVSEPKIVYDWPASGSTFFCGQSLTRSRVWETVVLIWEVQAGRGVGLAGFGVRLRRSPGQGVFLLQEPGFG